MEIALIKSYAEKPWRSPETYQLIEDSLREKWRVKSINTKNPEILYSFLTRLKRECNESIFAFNIAEYLDVKKAILSYEAAQKGLERTKLVQDEKMRDEIIDLSKRTFVAVGARDYSRVDLRMNHTGCYVLEINIMPGLGPHSFLPEAAKDIHALEYDKLIQKLAEDSMQRQKDGRRGSIVA